ncbi:MAG TPA: subclass B3 metallo-beta-lactamase [Vicinamibacterales bacterium]|nr:subclass B3 metallo-beta-lactamase [Vicinamibacterales bacterium]
MGTLIEPITQADWPWRRLMGSLGRAVAVAAAATVSMAQIRSPFKSDPPKVCSSCTAWNAPLEPFRVFGNTYYVGTEGLASVLITSDRGHILLDGGLPQSAEEIDAHIRRLGFRLTDVKLIVNSHAHYDHAGGIHALQAASGAAVAASRSGADALKRGENTTDDPQYGFGHDANAFPRVTSVHVVKDGDVLHAGPLSVVAHLTPGHTPGSTTWTWTSCEASRCLNVVYADSLNAVSAPGFRYSSDAPRVAAFRKSLTTVESLPCDLMISVHPGFSRLLEKRARAANGDPDAFVDPRGCREYVQSMRDLLDRRLALE